MLAPWYCIPSEILERIGHVDYILTLPLKVKFHDVFHVLLLKIYVKYIHHAIDWSVLEVNREEKFQSKPQCIFQHKNMML